MGAIAADDKIFKDAVEKEEGIVLVDFWAAWCGPCKAFAPVFEGAAEEHPDITFLKVDTEAQQDLAGALQIQAIPTLMLSMESCCSASRARCHLRLSRT